MTARFSCTFTALPEHIDELGHVNNAVWVRWMEQIATRHWETVAPPEHVAAYVWVVTRHEIDYRGNVGQGESVVATTFIPDPPHGARFDRCVDFANAAGKVIVSARTTWALIDKSSGRLVRVPAEVAAPFYSQV
ncbi:MULTISPECIES: thioesterase family protein [unclassified Novosphingobium]|uniref:acyl-CoA thioesterase n=1 Tax=unclassified Novosphingobium TaxID=2644732 RepID=UPI000D3000C9|nr:MULTISPECIES: acyl-CoA thioesterase [unclassified Novosphingobium]PTR09315.1 acyl-CoA thioester hydrolase [Novosphingobium sp. GV055]PUB02166.1 acyl-CoA thioester hydrolase [Novosphingobium sp. GV061]PUB18347.1 acyl-CoA thioester hydrolase [Novosphingobium sp. GV079]PUB40599.1 acyl-CoA thioester hydrolase [Novosphingobium sp. GV027]